MAAKGRGSFFSVETWKPEADEPHIGWFCSYTPEELLVAAGFVPCRIRSEDEAASGQWSDDLLPANICPYVRSLVDSARSGRYRHLAGVVFVSSCDAMRRLADVWTLYMRPEFSHRLEVPRRSDSLAEDFLIHQLQGLKAALEGEIGRRLRDEDIQEAIHSVNRTRELLGRLGRLRLFQPGLLPAEEFYRIAACAMGADKARFNFQAQRFLEALPETTAPSSPRPGIVLCGCTLQGSRLPALVEECGAAVVADDLCSGQRHFEGLVNTSLEPFRALARRYLHRPPCPRMRGAEARIQRLVDLSRQGSASGVIYHTLKFCDLVQADLPRLQMALEREGVPLLHVDRESLEVDDGQLKTRLQAFVELLGERTVG